MQGKINGRTSYCAIEAQSGMAESDSGERVGQLDQVVDSEAHPSTACSQSCAAHCDDQQEQQR